MSLFRQSTGKLVLAKFGRRRFGDRAFPCSVWTTGRAGSISAGTHTLPTRHTCNHKHSSCPVRHQSEHQSAEDSQLSCHANPTCAANSQCSNLLLRSRQHISQNLAASLAASTTACGITVGIRYANVPCRTNWKRLSSRVNQGKIVSRPYGRKVLQQQSAMLTSGNGIQCTSRAVHSWDDHCYSQTAQSCYLAYPHIQCLSRQTSQSGRTLTHMQRRIFRCKPCLHKLRCRTVSTTYRSIKLAREIQSSCHQTSQDQSLAVFWQEPGALRHSVRRSKACSMHGTGSALSQA